MVVIRLARGGAKKRPFFHVVVTDQRNCRDGRYIERIGYFNPLATGGEIRLSLNEERFSYWRSHGAQPSNRVHSLYKDFRRGPEAVAAKREKAKATKQAAIKAKEEALAAEKAKAEAEEAAAKEPEAAAKADEEKPAETEAKADESPAENKPAEDSK